jgi:hypothetical protein
MGSRPSITFSGARDPALRFLCRAVKVHDKLRPVFSDPAILGLSARRRGVCMEAQNQPAIL